MMSSEYGPQFSSIEPNIPHTFLPIFWIDGEEQANDEQLSLLKDSIYWCVVCNRVHVRESFSCPSCLVANY